MVDGLPMGDDGGIRRGRLAWRGVGTVVLALAASSALASDGGRRAGDVLSFALPLATLGVELARGDREGAGQFAWSFAATTGTAEVLKRVTGVERPDGSNDLSFPSGHAARAFSSAAYVRARHGLLPSLPLYAAAVYVGHTRVDARRHRWGDVLGAALLAEASAAWLVTPANRPTRLSVMADGEGVAVMFAARW